MDHCFFLFFSHKILYVKLCHSETKKTNDNVDDGDKGFNKQKMLNLAENFFDLINWKKITDYTVQTVMNLKLLRTSSMIIGK